MEKKFTIILKNNASLIQLVQDGPVPPVVPGLFLVLDFSLGLCLNLLLVITVATCPVLRRLSFNRILLHLCVICALDCILNLLAALAFIIVTRKWFSTGGKDLGASSAVTPTIVKFRVLRLEDSVLLGNDPASHSQLFLTFQRKLFLHIQNYKSLRWINHPIRIPKTLRESFLLNIKNR